MKRFLLALFVSLWAGAALGQNTVNCSAAQASTIATAQSLIAGKIDGVMPFLADNPLYVRWFGVYDSDRAATVKTNLETLKSYALISQPQYTCVSTGEGGCSPGTLAYVVAGTSFDISLCSSFFTLGTDGIDSTWGTILHEMSHFAMGPATGDECYGSAGMGSCLDLAINNPAAAVQNADSYQYFVESSPM
tara:strand:- start:262 stop:834 length:573 start_codon:yes stop_codon:yes gene_type:complete